MFFQSYIIGVLLFAFCLSTNDDEDSECPTRHRKAWHMLTNEEQMRYVTGFQELRNNGKLDVFIAAHHLSDTPESFADVHYTGEFFFWHSYFLTEIESQIRNLGGDYKCFSLPYWDFTVDADYINANDMPIYNSVLGADGDEDDDYCVTDDLWNVNSYQTTYLCQCMVADKKRNSNNCCLRRHHGARGHVPNADSMVPLIYTYHQWKSFQEATVKQHTYVHGYVSGHNNCTHMFGHNAAEDPLFILLHNFLMYLRGLRSSCAGYAHREVIDNLENYQPFAYDPYESDYSADSKPFVDLAMGFSPLDEYEWSAVHDEEITVRKVYDYSHFGISYELGTFWHSNPVLSEMCGEKLNDKWFYDTVDYDEYDWNTFNLAKEKQRAVHQIYNENLKEIQNGNTWSILYYSAIFLVIFCVVCFVKDQCYGKQKFGFQRLNGEFEFQRLDNYGSV